MSRQLSTLDVQTISLQLGPKYLVTVDVIFCIGPNYIICEKNYHFDFLQIWFILSVSCFFHGELKVCKSFVGVIWIIYVDLFIYFLINISHINHFTFAAVIKYTSIRKLFVRIIVFWNITVQVNIDQYYVNHVIVFRLTINA